MPRGALALTTVHGKKGARPPLVVGAKAAALAAGLAAAGMAAEAGPAVVEADPVAAEAGPAAPEADPVAVEVAQVAGVDPVVAVAGEVPRGRSRIGLAPTWARGRSADRPATIA